MSTIKLHEATKQFNLSNKLALYFLEKSGTAVKSHSSVIIVDQLELLRALSTDAKRIKVLTTEMERAERAKKSSPKTHGAAALEEIENVPAAPIAEAPKPVPKTEIVAPKDATVAHKTPEKPERLEEKHEKAEKQVKVEDKLDTPVKPAGESKPAIVTKEIKHPEKVEEKKHEAKEDKPIQKIPERVVAPRPVVVEKPVERKVQPPPPHQPKPQQYYTPPHSHRSQQSRRPYHPHKHHTGPRPVYPVKEKLKLEPIEVILPEIIQISDGLSLRELAEKLNVRLKYVEDKMLALNMAYQSNQIMDIEDVKKITQEIGVLTEVVAFEDDLLQTHVARLKAEQTKRPPVVTVMGHVDHGKTTLLDTLRKTRVAEKEAGGITQKIGAYKLKVKGNEFIFIDTPGHEAFSNLRARGAKVTDIVILVVAANDGVKPQTIEAITHARAAKVPLIVAINKIDMAGASADKVKQELTKHNVIVETWGGDVVSVEISAKLNQNLDSLLDMIHLVAEMQELKAYKDIPARGTIIESRFDSQLGTMATILIQHGKLKKGDCFVCGNSVGKIRSIFDDTGHSLAEANVPDPIEIMGFETFPQAGDVFQVISEEDLDKARRVIEKRQLTIKDAKSRDIMSEKKLSLQNIFQMLETNKTAVFPLLIKTDNFGSLEVLEQLVQKKSSDKLKIEIIYKGIGNITEGDILLASTSSAMILGFNTKAPQKIMALAKREKVEIKLYSVIYHLIEDIDKAIAGKIEPEYKETYIGKVEVLQLFKISKVGVVAGCVVREGRVTNKSRLKVVRGSDLVFEGEINSLKRIKDEVSEVHAGMECGIRLRNFNDIQEGDIFDAYELTLIT